MKGREDTVLCPSCGKRLPEGSKFCQFCGEKLDKPQIQEVQRIPEKAATPRQAAPEAEERGKQKKGTKRVAAAALILALLAGNVYQFLVIQSLKHPDNGIGAIVQEIKPVSSSSEEKEIDAWLQKYGEDYNRDPKFYANMNSITVKIGKSGTITITKEGTFPVTASMDDLAVCKTTWNPMFKVQNGKKTALRLEVTGVSAGITTIEFTRKDTGKSFPVLVHVVP